MVRRQIDKDTIDIATLKTIGNPRISILSQSHKDFATIDSVQDAAREQLRRKACRDKRALGLRDANGRKAICFAIDSVTHFKLFTSCS